ncbi:Radical SAM domain protein [Hymenobacter roseosalivarius DSM 11622]|uniref:Radical SAM domain protein n=1 Tax=Hymenobacter roseosalivarius DSM 11622 TaxID=645990 RepID=A0A1W1W464_9BACT|nr:radical SAM protein [Hymenobacter roseosalivarius]SMC00303.1 Radical SAM domain protein [Hymenobacter roseosalivarius DSM 11622]
MKSTLIPELKYLDAATAPAAATLVSVALPTLSPTVVASPLKRALLNGVISLAGKKLVFHYLRTPARIRQAAKQVQLLRETYYGELQVRKIACVAGRYYQEFQKPGWPSPAFTSYLATTLNRLVPFRPDQNTLQMVFMAITKKCPLACEHCFEWDALNQREKLSLANLRTMVANFQSRGVTHIFFSGGEPMVRINDMLEVLRTAKSGTDFWVFTSGFNFTPANAQWLRQAGLTGVSISLDHHEAARHNAFRGSADAYQQAIQAVVNAKEAGLVVALTLCATQAFTTAENLMAYAMMARQLGVTFIHVLEPRAVGHYAQQEVDLSPAQIKLLDEFYLKLNYSGDYHDWPIVHYYGYHQRRMGCSGGADRFLYVDTDGDMHACPFCQKKSGSAFSASFDEALGAVKQGGCHQFPASAI